MKNFAIVFLIFLLILESGAHDDLKKDYGALVKDKETIKKRALDYKFKECYNWQDIEIIIHGEIQE